VRHFHRLSGADPLPTDAAIVKTTVKGLRRSLGTAQAKKAPATNVVAKRLVDALPDGSLKGRRDRAMMMLGFAGAFRKSEVVPLDVEDLEFCDEGVRVTIRRSKTDQEGKGQTIAVLRGAGPFCPVRLLREWLDAAGITEGALFRQVPKGGKRVGTGLAAARIMTSSNPVSPGSGVEVRQPFHAGGLDFDCGQERSQRLEDERNIAAQEH
jgi:site-specific recombinase XerC